MHSYHGPVPGGTYAYHGYTLKVFGSTHSNGWATIGENSSYIRTWSRKQTPNKHQQWEIVEGSTLKQVTQPRTHFSSGTVVAVVTVLRQTIPLTASLKISGGSSTKSSCAKAAVNPMEVGEFVTVILWSVQWNIQLSQVK